jgi:hypothetical protein
VSKKGLLLESGVTAKQALVALSPLQSRDTTPE